jgi:hypothetical protein
VPEKQEEEERVSAGCTRRKKMSGTGTSKLAILSISSLYFKSLAQKNTIHSNPENLILKQLKRSRKAPLWWLSGSFKVTSYSSNKGYRHICSNAYQCRPFIKL